MLHHYKRGEHLYNKLNKHVTFIELKITISCTALHFNVNSLFIIVSSKFCKVKLVNFLTKRRLTNNFSAKSSYTSAICRQELNKLCRNLGQPSVNAFLRPVGARQCGNHLLQGRVIHAASIMLTTITFQSASDSFRIYCCIAQFFQNQERRREVYQMDAIQLPYVINPDRREIHF